VNQMLISVSAGITLAASILARKIESKRTEHKRLVIALPLLYL